MFRIDLRRISIRKTREHSNTQTQQVTEQQKIKRIAQCRRVGTTLHNRRGVQSWDHTSSRGDDCGAGSSGALTIEEDFDPFSLRFVPSGWSSLVVRSSHFPCFLWLLHFSVSLPLSLCVCVCACVFVISFHCWLCFSIEFPDRSLDLVATCESDVDRWFLGLQQLAPVTVHYLRRGMLLWRRLKMKINYYGLEPLLPGKPMQIQGESGIGTPTWPNDNGNVDHTDGITTAFNNTFDWDHDVQTDTASGALIPFGNWNRSDHTQELAMDESFQFV